MLGGENGHSACHEQRHKIEDDFRVEELPYRQTLSGSTP